MQQNHKIKQQHISSKRSNVNLITKAKGASKFIVKESTI